MTSVEFDEFFDHIVSLVRQVGPEISKAYWNRWDLDKTKGKPFDSATETEKRVEKMISEGIRDKYPTHLIIGKESAAAAGKIPLLTSSPTWIIEPVDTKKNFVHGFPWFAISVALYYEKLPQIAVIHNPVEDKLYSARRGRGSYLNGVPIRVSTTYELEKALLMFEPGSGRDPDKLAAMESDFRTLITRVRGFRSTGCGVLNLCLVAQGSADAYYEYGLKPWDLAAGVLMVQEAGGIVSDTTGDQLDIFGNRILAANNRSLTKQIAALLMHLGWSKRPTKPLAAVSKLDLWDAYDFSIALVRRLGKEVAEAFKKDKDVQMKSAADMVTETDKHVEKLIIEAISRKYPSHKVIGEESSAGDKPATLTNKPTWIIDPIDGTRNFVHSFPYCAISLALWCNKSPEIGIIYNPTEDQLFSAAKGRGAFLNGLPIRVSEVRDLEKALVMFEPGSGSRGQAKLDCVHANMSALMPKVRGIRTLGACSLDMCEVARGAADVFLEYGCFSWDVAAGVLIVREAGGYVCDTTGDEFDLFGRRVLCTGDPELVYQISPLLTHIDYPAEQ